ncbi:MAG: DUF393 domain-containing protein [Myxococcota bacterium]
MKKLTIYYDGACGICRNEMAKLKARDRLNLMQLVDASRPDFNAQAEGLDPVALRRWLHLKDERGRVLVGVDAFALIWSVTGHPILSKLCQLPVSKQIAQVIYRLISRYRYLLSNDKACKWTSA